MRCLRVAGALLAVMFVVTLTAVSLSAQTTSTVTGTVLDKTGATVPKAKVELLDTAAGIANSTTTGDDGRYTFPAVRPGTYKITVTGAGFRQSAVSGVVVEVGKSALVNVVLEVGAVTQVVEVHAGTGTELQTLDATMGNVLDDNILKNMPTLNRDATSLLLLQPTAIPGFNSGVPGSGEGNLAGGTVAGARADQNTFMIDGGDASSNMEGGGGYNTAFVATPRAVVPTPVESLEEFRVETNNQGVTFSRSAGAEVEMVTRRGTNQWHGAGYWYHQNDELNANDWFRNKLGIQNPEWRDNRYGGRVGGPIWKDRTFFFIMDEERHFFTTAPFSRLDPTAAMRAGILEFKDAAGNIVAYNLNPVATVDPGAGPGDPNAGKLIAPSGLDPRGKGISPAIAAEWATMPLPNDFTGGDGLRTANFTSTVPNTTNEHDAIARVDHKINDKWDFMTSFRYSVSDIVPANVQVDEGGLTKGCTKGSPCSTSSRPLQPRYLVTGLTGRITPNLINEFHFDWLRHWWDWSASGAHTQVVPTSLSDTILQIYNENKSAGLVPINVDTQNARQRTWDGRDYTFIDNITWIHGKHMWQFGGRSQLEHFLHIRDDKVVGGLTTPIYYAAKGGQFSNISGFAPGVSEPQACSGGVTTNCLQSTDATNWKRAYISTLGMIDSATQVLTRNASLAPNPAFTDITQTAKVDSYEFHFSDTWRVTPSFTLTYGLTWGVQMPPYEVNGLQTMMVDAGSGQIITANQLLNAKKLAGLSGQVINPTFAFVPIGKTGRKYPYDPDYTNLGPRLAGAWNPSFSSGFLGRLFGDHKTVLRSGWSRAFDRVNGVGIVLTPALGIGFGDLSVCTIPGITGACNAGGTPATNFRIGVDGKHITVPPLPAVSGSFIVPGLGAPIQPAGANSVYEGRDFRIDPRRQVGGTDMIDFSIQRELPWNMLLEVGYVGRLSRDLYENIDLNSIPYMFTRAGQSYATAFDKVAAQLQAGVAPTAVTAQPWFESMLGPTTSKFCTGFSSCTAAAAASNTAAFATHGPGAVWFGLEPSFVTGPMTAANTQSNSMDWTMSNGLAAYHSAFVTLRKRASFGLTFDANYTFSHGMDDIGLTQENTCAVTDAYFLNRNYGPSTFDRRHAFNLLVNYELPLGKGKRFANGAVADRVFGGWSFSGVYTAASGLPLMVYDDSACGTEFGTTPANGDPIGLIPLKSGVIGTSRNDNPTLSASGLGSDSATGSPNAFANPDQVRAGFRYETFADRRLGFGAIRGLFRWNFDFGLAKTTRITERVSTRFDVQFVNAFNNPMFSGSSIFASNGLIFAREPNSDLSDPATFGVLDNQFNSPRYIQIGLRFDF
ncbi:MAG: carboxypeptidase-like regulatory domain-containing protein [Candidatus Acidiferrales bacterium]